MKGIEPGSIPRKNETLPTVLVGTTSLKGQPTSQHIIGSAHAAASCAGVGLRRSGCGIVGSIGQPMGDYGLGYIGIDRKVRTRCQRDGRPTTTGHDRGHYSPGNVSSMPGANSRGPYNKDTERAVELRLLRELKPFYPSDQRALYARGLVVPVIV